MNRLKICACAIAYTLFLTPAVAASITGAITVRISGAFRAALTLGGGATCDAVVTLAPDTTSATLTIADLGARLLSQSAIQKSTLRATLNATRTTFTCNVVVPYTFANVATAGQKLIVAIDVKGSDPGFVNPVTNAYTPPLTNPGHTRQVVSIVNAISQTISLPTATTSYAVKL